MYITLIQTSTLRYIIIQMYVDCGIFIHQSRVGNNVIIENATIEFAISDWSLHGLIHMQ